MRNFIVGKLVRGIDQGKFCSGRISKRKFHSGRISKRDLVRGIPQWEI